MLLNFEVGVLEVKGPDAQKFLQAIVSSDVDQLDVQKTQSSLLLTPAGKLISTMWIHKIADEHFLLVVERALSDLVLETFKKYLIRTKAELSDLSNEYEGIVFDSNHSTETGMISIETNHLDSETLNLGLIMRSDDDVASVADAQQYDELRISYGAVSTNHDLVDEIIPQEANLEKISVSFSKGCYLGQELVCRIDSREASTPFSFFAIELESLDSNFDLQPEILVDGASVGKITSIRNIGNADNAYGRFHAVGRVSRKGTATILENSYKEVEIVDKEGKSLRVENVEPVSGYFSV